MKSAMFLKEAQYIKSYSQTRRMLPTLKTYNFMHANVEVIDVFKKSFEERFKRLEMELNYNL